MYILLFTCEIYLYTYLISIYFNNITYIYIYYRHIYIYIYLHVYRSSVPSQSKISQPKKQFFGNAKTGDFASGNPGTKNSLVKYEHVPRWLLKLFQQCDVYNCNDKIYIIYIYIKKKKTRLGNEEKKQEKTEILTTDKSTRQTLWIKHMLDYILIHDFFS